MKKWILRIGLTVIIVMVALAIYVSRQLRPPSEDGLPDYAKNLPKEFKLANAEFDVRVRSRFPVGGPEQDLVQALTRQGYQTHQDLKFGAIERPGFPCQHQYGVNWKSDDKGTVTSVTGSFMASCL